MKELMILLIGLAFIGIGLAALAANQEGLGFALAMAIAGGLVLYFGLRDEEG